MSSDSQRISSIFRSIVELDGWIRRKTAGWDLFDKASEQYAKRMDERYNRMKILGMAQPVSLSGIYVRVNVLDKITSQRRISVTDLESRFDRDQKRFGEVRSTQDGVTVANTTSRLFVLGKPGSGKTTFLRYLALCALSGTLKHEILPVFVSLKDWSETNKSLIDFIASEFEICRVPYPKEFAEHLLSSGKCLVLLDGLDEVDSNASARARDIRMFTDKYNRNRYVLSCRIAAYNYVFEQFTDVELADFDEDQIREFVNAWFSNKRTMAERFMNAIEENHSIREMASIPLLLTLLCINFNSTLTFPINRAELYSEAIDVLLKEWDSSRSIKRDVVYKNLSLQQKRNMLSLLGYKTFVAKRYFFSSQTATGIISEYIEHFPALVPSNINAESRDILKAIESQHGIVVERARNVYSFSHLTFQEYYTARFIVDNGMINDITGNRIFDTRWHETIILAAGLMTSADAIIDLILDQLIKIQQRKVVGTLLRKADRFISSTTPLGDEASRALALSIILRRSESARLQRIASDLDHKIDLRFAQGFTMDQVLDQVLDASSSADISDIYEDEAALKQLDRYLTATHLLLQCLRVGYVTRGTRQRAISVTFP